MFKALARSTRIPLAAAIAMHCPDLAAQTAPAVEFYGSLRTHVEAVRPDRQDRLGAYTSVRDAYSRLGAKVDYPLDDQLALIGQVEVAVDSGNLRLRDPYDQGDASRPDGERLRLARVGLSGDFGSITYGQQWMPYYNAIASPVDRFSSYYSGYATYTVFRVARTLAYSTPELGGFSLSAAYAGREGNKRSTSRIDDRRWQATASYALGDTRFALGIDDRGNAAYGRNRLYGLSASHQAGKVYLAVKYEIFDTGNAQNAAFSADGNQAINLFGSYALERNTIKLMLAKVENYGDYIVHLGIDHRLSKDFKLFAEYYRETETAAISSRRRGLGDVDARISGGHVFAAGLRYDF